MADALAIDWVGRPCPRCGYVRTPLDTNPAWQCPRCEIAYAKYAAAAVHARFAQHGSEMAQRAGSDSSLFGLVLANVVALAIAWATHLSLREMLLVYWMQSVIIGVTSVIRMVKLHGFATDGFRMNGQPVPETAASKVQAASFFALHYGFFHAGYLVFIAAGRGDLGSPAPYLVCALAFAVNHAVSLRHNLESDAAGRPNLGTLMFLPYARIVPMHLTILSGLAFSGALSVSGLLLFGALKSAADVLMHVVEHHVMATGSARGANTTVS